MSDATKNIYVILHNVHAVSKVLETAHVVYGLGFQNFVVTKAEGSAAQSGVPDANRFAIKMKKNFMVLPDLKDALELLEVEEPLLLVSPVLTKERVDLGQLVEQTKTGEKLVLVFSASNSSFSRKEMDLGKCVSLQSKIDIGPSGTAAVVLYALSNEVA